MPYSLSNKILFYFPSVPYWKKKFQPPPFLAYLSPKDTSKFSIRTSYDLFLPDDSKRLSFLLPAWLADASSKTLLKGDRDAYTLPASLPAQQTNVVSFTTLPCQTHGTLLVLRVSFSERFSCFAFSRASAFSSFFAFTVWSPHGSRSF